MFKSISSIFPDGYTNPPSETQVRAEVERWIDSVRNVPDDFKHLLNRIACPYMREAYAVVLDTLCEQLEADYDERLGARVDNCWKPYWPERHNSIRRIVRKARDEQEEIDDAKPQKPITPVAAAKLIQEQKKASKTAQPTQNTTINMTINNYGGTQNIFEAGATQHIERLICTSAPEETHLSAEAPAEPAAPSAPSLCTYIIPNDIKSAEEIEQEMLAAARKNAPALANYIKHALRLGLIDLRGDNGKTVYETLQLHFGFSYSYANWMAYYS